MERLPRASISRYSPTQPPPSTSATFRAPVDNLPRLAGPYQTPVRAESSFWGFISINLTLDDPGGKIFSLLLLTPVCYQHGTRTPPGIRRLIPTDITKTGDVIISRSFFFCKGKSLCSAQRPVRFGLGPRYLGNLERNTRAWANPFYDRRKTGNSMITIALKNIHKSNLQNEFVSNMPLSLSGRYAYRRNIASEMQGLEL